MNIKPVRPTISLVRSAVSAFMLAGACSLGGAAFASDQLTGGTVTIVEALQYAPTASEQYTYFYLTDTNRTALPACANGSRHWIINGANTDLAKQQLAIVMLAKATGGKLGVNGTGDCTRTLPSGGTAVMGGEIVRQLWIE